MAATADIGQIQIDSNLKMILRGYTINVQSLIFL